MKLSLLAVTMIAALSGFSAHASDPDSVKATFMTGYVPNGFDSNDKVQVVAEGLFSNTCYRPAGYEKKVDTVNKVIEVTAKAYKYSGMCMQMVVPYHEVIDLGILDAGTYRVKDTSMQKDLGTLSVKLATSSSPDDYLYAPVSQAFIETDADGRYVVVTGQFTNSCMELKDFRVEVQKNVIVAVPISEAADREDCTEGSFPFRKAVRLDDSVAHGRYLLHVRSLNSNAINNLIDL